MKIPEWLHVKLMAYAYDSMLREPDFILGHADKPVLHRWRMFDKGGFSGVLFNVYVHKFFRSDEDRALHDHPTDNISIILNNGYEEIMCDPKVSFGSELQIKIQRNPGDIVFRLASTPHRVVVRQGKPSISIFINGPRRRHWA